MKFFEIDTVNEPLKCLVPLSIFQWKKNKIGQFILIKLKNKKKIICKAFPHNLDDFYGNCNLISSKKEEINFNGEEIEEFQFINENEIFNLKEIFIECDNEENFSNKLIQGLVLQNNFYLNLNKIYFKNEEIREEEEKKTKNFFKIDKTTKLFFMKENERIMESIDDEVEINEKQEKEEEDFEMISLENEIIEILSNFGKILIYGNSNKKNLILKIEKKMKKKFKNLNDLPDNYLIKNEEIFYIENIEDLIIEEKNFIEILKKKKISFLGGTNKITIKNIKNIFKKNLKLFKFPLPNEKRREIFFKKILFNFPNLNFDLNLFLNSTEDFCEFDLLNLFRNSLIESKLNFENLNEKHFEKSLLNIKSKFEHKSEKFENIKWEEIGGLKETKLILKQCSEWPLIYKEKFKNLGIQIPRGILLYGPPGCSKTKLIKALATSTKSKFLYLNSASIYSSFVGESEESIRKIFENAKKSKSSIIFFDEIDSLVGKRDSNSKNSSVEKRVLSTLLNEMDGIEEISKNILIVCATNRPEMIDSALLRPGRIDYVVYVPPPNFEERIEIFKIYTKNLNLIENFNFNSLSQNFDNFTGAEIESICRNVSLYSINNQNEKIEEFHFLNVKKLIHPIISFEMLQKYDEFKRNFNASSKK